MTTDPVDALWLDERSALSLAELAELSGLPEGELRELVDYGALAPLEPAAASWTFSARWVVVARRARRLRDDFDIDTHALGVLLGFVERIEALEAQLRALRAQAPR
jgi:chaperone modulatory protein CbpM